MRHLEVSGGSTEYSLCHLIHRTGTIVKSKRLVVGKLHCFVVLELDVTILVILRGVCPFGDFDGG